MGKMYIVFFFSSRRLHTRLSGDWSSDVCSSDLVLVLRLFGAEPLHYLLPRLFVFEPPPLFLLFKEEYMVAVVRLDHGAYLAGLQPEYRVLELLRHLPPAEKAQVAAVLVLRAQGILEGDLREVRRLQLHPDLPRLLVRLHHYHPCVDLVRDLEFLQVLHVELLHILFRRARP